MEENRNRFFAVTYCLLYSYLLAPSIYKHRVAAVYSQQGRAEMPTQRTVSRPRATPVRVRTLTRHVCKEIANAHHKPQSSTVFACCTLDRCSVSAACSGGARHPFSPPL